jgi:nucleoside-diphosphate-sugar epimerase
LGRDRYLITGASGFIGGWIAETLFLEDRVDVRAGIHNWSGAPRLARFPMEIVSCNILDPSDVERAVNGATHVIHCAKGSSRESIVTGTENLLQASLKHGVKRFVHMSTAEVYGSPAGRVDENTPCERTGDMYGESKLDAEMKCLEYGAKGLPVTILRPSIVYGPFAKTWILNIGMKLRSGTWGTFREAGDGTCNLIYISDLVNATLLCARDDRAIGEVYNLNGPEQPSWNDYFRRYNAALGLSPLKEIDPGRTRLRSAATEPVRAVAKFARDHMQGVIRAVASRYQLARHIITTMERGIKLTPRPADLGLYGRKAYYASTKFEQALGWQPTYGVDTSLKLSVQWLDQISGFK